MLDGLSLDLNGYLVHLHEYVTLRKHDQKNLDDHDVQPKLLTVNNPIRA